MVWWNHSTKRYFCYFVCLLDRGHSKVRQPLRKTLPSLNCFTILDTVGANCVRPFSSALIEIIKRNCYGVMLYLSMLTQSYMVFNFRISLSTILPISDSSITAGEHSSPLLVSAIKSFRQEILQFFQIALNEML